MLYLFDRPPPLPWWPLPPRLLPRGVVLRVFLRQIWFRRPLSSWPSHRRRLRPGKKYGRSGRGLRRARRGRRRLDACYSATIGRTTRRNSHRSRSPRRPCYSGFARPRPVRSAYRYSSLSCRNRRQCQSSSDWVWSDRGLTYRFARSLRNYSHTTAGHPIGRCLYYSRRGRGRRYLCTTPLWCCHNSRRARNWQRRPRRSSNS